jgi:translocation and assembly module TamB
MSEAEIATLLATGRPQLKRGGGGVSEASGAASAIGALMSDQLKKGIAAKLPVDVLNFQAGEEGVFEGSTLEAGSYVTDRIYVGYQRTFTEEENPRRNQNEVRVEYQLAPRWTLESSYGDHAAGGVDLFWTRDF